MKIYFVTRTLLPNTNSHFLNSDLTPDMNTPVEMAGAIITSRAAKFYKQEYGEDSVSNFSCESVFSPLYTERVYRVKNENSTVSYFVKL